MEKQAYIPAANPKRVSLADIAKKVGVSRNTVSLAMRNSASISEITRKKIVKVAKEMGYSPTNQLSHGQTVFVNKKAPSELRYISRDVDSHNGGVWKAARTVRDLGSKLTRSGTYSRWLNIKMGD